MLYQCTLETVRVRSSGAFIECCRWRCSAQLAGNAEWVNAAVRWRPIPAVRANVWRVGARERALAQSWSDLECSDVCHAVSAVLSDWVTGRQRPLWCAHGLTANSRLHVVTVCITMRIWHCASNSSSSSSTALVLCGRLVKQVFWWWHWHYTWWWWWWWRGRFVSSGRRVQFAIMVSRYDVIADVIVVWPALCLRTLFTPQHIDAYRKWQRQKLVDCHYERQTSA